MGCPDSNQNVSSAHQGHVWPLRMCPSPPEQGQTHRNPSRGTSARQPWTPAGRQASSSCPGHLGNSRKTGSQLEAFQQQRAWGARVCLPTVGAWGAAGVRLITETKGQGFTSKLHQTALWAFDPSFSLLCSAFRAAHRPCCRRLPPSVTLHLLPSTPLPHLIAQSSLRLLRQEQPFSPAWHVAAFCTSALPHQPPPRVRDSCCFFPASSRPPLWDHPSPSFSLKGSDHSGGVGVGVVHAPRLAHQHISSPWLLRVVWRWTGNLKSYPGESWDGGKGFSLSAGTAEPRV